MKWSIHLVLFSLVVAVGGTAQEPIEPAQPRPGKEELAAIARLRQMGAEFYTDPLSQSVDEIILYSREKTAELVASFTVFPKLRSLRLASLDAGDDLVPLLERLPTLQSVLLVHCGLTPKGVERLAKSISGREGGNLVARPMPRVVQWCLKQQSKPDDSPVRKLRVERCHVAGESAALNQLMRINVPDLYFSRLCVSAGLGLCSSPKEEIPWLEADLELCREHERDEMLRLNMGFANIGKAEVIRAERWRIEAEILLAQTRRQAER